MVRDRDLRSFDEDQINVSIPRPLNARLDALVELTNAAGENTSRKEIVSALLLTAPEDGATLAERVRIFRTAGARDATVSGYDEAFFLNPSPRGPGPRPRRSG